MMTKEGATKEELPRQRFRARDVAVGLHPRAAQRLPTAIPHPLLDDLKQLRIILPHEIIQLGLALAEAEFGVLLHQADDVVERPSALAPGLAQRPKPGHVNVGVSNGSDVHVQRSARLGNVLPQGLMGGRHTGVKTFTERLASVQRFERLVQGSVQVTPRWLVFVQMIGHAQRHPGQGDEVARGLINLHQRAFAHQQPGVSVIAQTARPTMQGQQMRSAVEDGYWILGIGACLPPRACPEQGRRVGGDWGGAMRQHYLLVMPVAGSKGHAINVGQALGVAEIASFSHREVQGNGGINVPVGGDLKASAEDEIRVGLTPVRTPRNRSPVSVVYFRGNRRSNQRIFQLEVPKRRQWPTTAVNQWLDQL